MEDFLMSKIKIGIFGAGRGASVGKNLVLAGAEIVALCDYNEDRFEGAYKKIGKDFALYSDFDKFIEHDMDAVVIGNDFNDHARFAIKCLERGIHVLSECTAAGTLAECVALARAADKSNAVYMLAENYPFMIFNREMQKICREGTLGKILYAEGEYNHPGDPNDIKFKKTYNYKFEHWRNFNPRSYYLTHSLGPLMAATKATPKKVTAYAAFAPVEGDVPNASYVGDRAAVILTQNDDGSIYRFTGCAAFGAHHNAYRICGTEGQVENVRGMEPKVMLRYNSWSKPEGMEENNLIDPSWNDPDEEFIKQTGHGGGDYLVAREFLDCIRENRQPDMPFDVYSAINMSAVAIFAHRSVLEGGANYDIPDFRLEEDRVKFENDWSAPYYLHDGTAPTLPSCSHPDYKPTETQLKLFKELVIDS